MKFRELVKKIQHDAGFSDAESQEALELMVESIAERLTAGEVKDFASQLPPELQYVALGVEPATATRQDIIEEFMEKEAIDAAHAKKQVLTAWKAIKAAVSPGEIEDIRSQFSRETAVLLS